MSVISKNCYRLNELAACSHCDLIVIPGEIPFGMLGRCFRCGTVLSSTVENSVQKVIALSFAGLVLFIPSITLPMMTFSVAGLHGSSSVLQASLAMLQSLRQKEDDIMITAIVKKQYHGLVKEKSRFYNLSGVELKASLDGIKIQSGSLEIIVAGGIGFYTPTAGNLAPGQTQFELYDDLDAAENRDRIEITVHFPDTTGLKPGMRIKYNDIAIGEVGNIAYENKMKGIRVTAKVDREAQELLKEGARFWLVRPEFSLTGTQHLDTLVSGSYIAVLPGTGKSLREFTAVSREKGAAQAIGGLQVVLETDDLFSLKVGSAIYYRRFKVGEVTAIRLADDFRKVLLDSVVYAPYIPLVRKNTVFWNASGIRVEGGLFSGISVATESFEALMGGGIAMATPNIKTIENPVEEGYLFPLYADAKKEWLQWTPSIEPSTDPTQTYEH